MPCIGSTGEINGAQERAANGFKEEHDVVHVDDLAGEPQHEEGPEDGFSDAPGAAITMWHSREA